MFGTIRNSSGEVLDYTFHAGTEGPRHIAVLGHGVTGNKDRPFVVALAEGLAAAGIHALRFSFAGNGASEGRFADATISKAVGDLGAVLDAWTRPKMRASGARAACTPRRAECPFTCCAPTRNWWWRGRPVSF